MWNQPSWEWTKNTLFITRHGHGSSQQVKDIAIIMAVKALRTSQAWYLLSSWCSSTSGSSSASEVWDQGWILNMVYLTQTKVGYDKTWYVDYTILIFSFDILVMWMKFNYEFRKELPNRRCCWNLIFKHFVVKMRERRISQQSKDLNLAIILISTVIMFFFCHLPR